MSSPLLISTTIVAAIFVVGLLGGVFWLLRQSQQLKLSELSAREKLIAREAELHNSAQ